MRHLICLLLILPLAACGDDGGSPPAPQQAAPEDPPQDETPPVEDPPQEEEDPVIEEPPVEEPPIEEPPIEEPPVEDPTEPCPEGEECIDQFPFEHTDTTLGANSEIDSYGCAPDTDESGPERSYRVEVAETGFLSLDLLDVAEGADVDVHLLREDAGCLDRGHWRAGGYVEAGVYRVVVDTWVDDEGQPYPGGYTLRVNLTTQTDLIDLGIDPELAHDALYAFGAGWSRGDTERFEYAITDFSMHSSLRRQWVVDLSNGDVLWHLHVSHGEGSITGDDPGFASVFSNIPESHQSSLGMLVSAETYVGDYGYSYRLDGLEPGFNHRVRPRDIVMHPWIGSTPEYVDEHGILRPSWGCPAIDPAISTDYVDRLNSGVLMLFWHPDSMWHDASEYMP